MMFVSRKRYEEMQARLNALEVERGKNVTVIVQNALESAAGENAIVNLIRRNAPSIRRSVGG